MRGIKLERPFERIYFEYRAQATVYVEETELPGAAPLGDVIEEMMVAAGAAPSFEAHVPLGHVLFIMGEELAGR